MDSYNMEDIIMSKKSNSTLEFNIILERLSEFALSENAKNKLLSLKPFLSERICQAKMVETTEAVQVITGIGSPPLASMKEIAQILELTEKGSMLIPEQLINITDFISACKRMKSYLKRAQTLGVELAFYGGSFNDLTLLFEEIDRSIRNGIVDDNATSDLCRIRRKIEHLNTSIKTKMESIQRSKKEWLDDGYITTRNGRFVLPVKKEYKNKIEGTLIDTSNTGNTCFIEPASVRKLQESLSILQIEEDNEARKILYVLTAFVEEHISELKINMDCMESLDVAFAKGKMAIHMDAIPVTIGTKRKIVIKQGRHPLLSKELCVPLDFEIGGEITGVVVTGPNMGGKTVALKTVGLLSLMAQSGLHVPVAEGSSFCMHSNVLCDIGDGQSITENLSTFSAHIKNIISILENLSNESLVLLDELGSGTDPTEGMGLAVCILNELKEKGCLFVATTHYPEIKDFAMSTDGLINARMEFDRDNLKALYKLQIGEAGESCALYIARRLGFPEHMLKRAHFEAYGNKRATKQTNSDMIFPDVTMPVEQKRTERIQKEIPKRTQPLRSEEFNVGDSVMVYPQQEIGIVYKKSNDKGELVVQIKGKKQMLNHKKIKLIIAASELYPADYDFSIIFDTADNRKAKHDMARKFDPNIVVKYEDGEIL